MRWVAARGGNTRRPGVALALVSVRPFGRYFAAGSDGVANGPGRSKRGRDASRPPAAPPWPNATARVHSMRGSPAGGRVALAEQNRVAGSFRAGCVALVEQNVHPGSPTGGRVAVAEHFAGLAAASARDDGVGEQNRCRLPPECRDVRPRRRVSPGSPPECRDVRRRRRARRSSAPRSRCSLLPTRRAPANGPTPRCSPTATRQPGIAARVPRCSPTATRPAVLGPEAARCSLLPTRRAPANGPTPRCSPRPTRRTPHLSRPRPAAAGRARPSPLLYSVRPRQPRPNPAEEAGGSVARGRRDVRPVRRTSTFDDRSRPMGRPRGSCNQVPGLRAAGLFISATEPSGGPRCRRR